MTCLIFSHCILIIIVLFLSCLLYCTEFFSFLLISERLHATSSSCPAGKYTHYQCPAATWSQTECCHHGERHIHIHRSYINAVSYFSNLTLFFCQNGNTALSIAKRLGYISVVDTLKVVTEEVITTTTVCIYAFTY